MSVDALSPRGKQLCGGLAMNLQLVDEHGKEHADEVLVIVMFLIAHVRNKWPQALVSLQEPP